MSKLFESFQIGNVKLRNRLVVSPMCQYSSVDGYASDWHLVHLGSRAVGGASLVISEATAVSPEGRISPADLGIWEDGHIENLSRITAFIRSQGSVAGIQLAHAGRKASTAATGGPLSQGAWTIFAPSPLAFTEGWLKPQELDEAGIQKIKADFLEAAKRALKAGFQVIEIHAAHGYLLHEFLSPLSNKRQDAWGGSLEGRSKLLREIARDLRKLIANSDVALFVRISATDWVEGESWTPDQSVQLCKWLKEDGVDLIDVSSGGLAHDAKIAVGPLYQVPFAAKIKKEADLPVACVGLITSAKEGEGILERGEADLIFMARQFLRDPYFPLHAAKELAAETEWPRQYARAK